MVSKFFVPKERNGLIMNRIYMNKTYTKWFVNIILGICTTLFLIALTTYIVDPFQYFRVSKLYKPVFINDTSRYMNAGLLKNYSYDSAIIGNSMTENFLTENLKNNMGWNTIKLSMQGGTSYEDSLVLGAVIREGKAKNILTTFDVFAYDKEGKATVGDMPTYLYNDIKIDDIRYLLNFNQLKKEIGKIYTYNFMLKNSRFTDLKMAYFWGDTAVYTKDNVFKNILDSFNLSNTKDLKLPTVNTFDQVYTGTIINNFNNHLFKYISENPQIKFYIVLPPYSIVYWKQQQYVGAIDEVEYSINYVIEKLLSMTNVKIYDFQNEKLFTHNLDTYRDMVHHSHDANLYIIANLMSDKYLLTEDNWKEAREKLHEDMLNYIIPEYSITK
jgi:hypothetical protein